MPYYYDATAIQGVAHRLAEPKWLYPGRTTPQAVPRPSPATTRSFMLVMEISIFSVELKFHNPLDLKYKVFPTSSKTSATTCRTDIESVGFKTQSCRKRGGQGVNPPLPYILSEIEANPVRYIKIDLVLLLASTNFQTCLRP